MVWYLASFHDVKPNRQVRLPSLSCDGAFLYEFDHLMVVGISKHHISIIDFLRRGITMSFVTFKEIISKIIIVIAITILVVGCSTTGTVNNSQGNPTMSVDERLKQESNKFVKKVATGSIFGAVIGGAAGAALGAIIVAASGGRGGELIWQLAVAGAATGAIVGGASAVYFDEKQKQYAKEEDRINSMIADVKTDNEDLVAYLKTVDEYNSSSKEKIAYIRQQSKNTSGDIKSVKKELEKIQESQKLIAQAAQFMREKKKAYAEAVAMQNKISGTRSTASLDDQISELEVNITHLEWEEKSLVNALAITPAG